MAASSYPTDLHKSVDESEIWDTDSSSDSESDIDETVINKNPNPTVMNSSGSTKPKVVVYLERCKTLDPDLYGYMIGLCKLALKHYQIHDPTRAQNTFEFVSLDKAFVWFNKGVEYTLTISTKNRITGEVESFEAVGLVVSSDVKIKLGIVSSDLLK